MPPAPRADRSAPEGGDCRLCGLPLTPKSKRYHPWCLQARKAAQYSGPSARERARRQLRDDATGPWMRVS